jgi:hypothetical protein
VVLFPKRYLPGPWAVIKGVTCSARSDVRQSVGQDGILRAGCLPAPRRVANPPQITNLPHKRRFQR